jgi:nucleoside-diphosphate-sugar epimerase
LVATNAAGDYRRIPFPPDRRAIDIGDYYADFSKIRRELGWTPRVPLAEGLRRSLDYFRQHLPHYL